MKYLTDAQIADFAFLTDAQLARARDLVLAEIVRRRNNPGAVVQPMPQLLPKKARQRLTGAQIAAFSRLSIADLRDGVVFLSWAADKEFDSPAKRKARKRRALMRAEIARRTNAGGH